MENEKTEKLKKDATTLMDMISDKREELKDLYKTWDGLVLEHYELLRQIWPEIEKRIKK